MTFTEAMAAIKDPVVHAAVFEERERLYTAIQEAERLIWRQRPSAAHAILERTLSTSELTEL